MENSREISLLDVWNEKYVDNRPKRLLSLDGGGILGVISLEILSKMESDLAIKTGLNSKFRLGNYFDYIAGTSTGAIIATGLAIGMSVSELKVFYEESGELMFTKSTFRKRLRAKYHHKNLEILLKRVIGEHRTLGSKDLRCLLLVMTKNGTTNSPWPITNNPFSKYNDPNHPFCNLDIPLWQVVRASTAAPTFFKPERIDLNNSGERLPFFFIDGGVTPYNNPAFALYRKAVMPEYNLSWPTGEQKLLLVSVGTGGVRRGDAQLNSRGRTLWKNGAKIPPEMMHNMSLDQDINCRFVGRCVFGQPLDQEIGDMKPRDKNGNLLPISHGVNRKFLYARFDPDVSREGLDALGLTNIMPNEVTKMDGVKNLQKMQKVGRAYSVKKMNTDFFDLYV